CTEEREGWGEGVASYTATELFGTDDNPHWLTKLLLLQILGADTSTGIAHQGQSQTPPQEQQQQQQALTSPGRKSEDVFRTLVNTPNANPQPSLPPSISRTQSRTEVISVWARVGELCRLAGDECSFRAIAAARRPHSP
ncbi:hypothetical protein C0991_009945, partial [Blastosporella zonata]